MYLNKIDLVIFMVCIECGGFDCYAMGRCINQPNSTERRSIRLCAEFDASDSIERNKKYSLKSPKPTSICDLRIDEQYGWKSIRERIYNDAYNREITRINFSTPMSDPLDQLPKLNKPETNNDNFFGIVKIDLSKYK